MNHASFHTHSTTVRYLAHIEFSHSYRTKAEMNVRGRRVLGTSTTTLHLFGTVMLLGQLSPRKELTPVIVVTCHLNVIVTYDSYCSNVTRLYATYKVVEYLVESKSAQRHYIPPTHINKCTSMYHTKHLSRNDPLSQSQVYLSHTSCRLLSVVCSWHRRPERGYGRR